MFTFSWYYPFEMLFYYIVMILSNFFSLKGVLYNQNACNDSVLSYLSKKTYTSLGGKVKPMCRSIRSFFCSSFEVNCCFGTFCITFGFFGINFVAFLNRFQNVCAELVDQFECVSLQ